jgi:hypothetical protein
MLAIARDSLGQVTFHLDEEEAHMPTDQYIALNNKKI